MGKSVYIAEKPSVAQEFAKALHLNLKRKDGYLESDEAIVTWCVGHLVTMKSIRDGLCRHCHSFRRNFSMR